MSWKILLVDDEPLLRQAFRTLLEASGYEVIEAGTAADALDLAVAGQPALVFLDLGLPDRPGIEVAHEIVERSTARVVALTGRSEPGIARACANAGCIGHLIKPISPSDLVRGIPGWLESPATDDPAGSPV